MRVFEKKKNTRDVINLISEYEWNFHPYSRAHKNIKHVSVFLDYSKLWTLLIQVGHITSRTVFIYLYKGNRKTISCRENDYSTSFESPRTSGKTVVNATASFLSPLPPFPTAPIPTKSCDKKEANRRKSKLFPGSSRSCESFSALRYLSFCVMDRGTGFHGMKITRCFR